MMLEISKILKGVRHIKRTITNYQAQYQAPAPEDMIKAYKEAKKISQRTIRNLRRDTHRQKVEEASGSM
jgi:hypothetical protein